MVTEENVSFCNCFCSFGIRFYLTPLHKIEMSKLKSSPSRLENDRAYRKEGVRNEEAKRL